MDVTRNYPQYAPIAGFIRNAGIDRVPALAEAIAGFLMDSWSFIKEGPEPSPVIIEGFLPVRHGADLALRLTPR
jgi:hypothetical protein